MNWRASAPWRSRISAVLLYLLLGAVANLLVAWACLFAAAHRERLFAEHIELMTDADRDMASIHSTLEERNDLVVYRGLGWSARHVPIQDEQFWSALRERFTQASRGNLVTVPSFAPPCFVRVLAGWPLLAFDGGWGDGHLVSAVDATRLVGGMNDPLPYAPLWPGFAFNTLFYAAFLWLLIRGPFALRRWRRVRRRLCGNCGYDLRGAEHGACPECGASARPALRRVAAAASRPSC